ncbi:MAG: YceD family protein [Acidimicrobiales bacterium]|nr:YceD family protein [Acidimicrobiales bacterium]
MTWAVRDMAPANPLIIGVTELLGHPGCRREVHCDAELDELRVSQSVVDAGAPIAVDVVLEAMVGEAISVQGTVAVNWIGECRRCLELVQGRLVAEVNEIFEVHPTEGETYPIDAEQLDLEPLVRDAIVLSLPLSPLCRAECLGPDPESYPVRTQVQAQTESGSGSGERSPDPRWSALDALKAQLAGPAAAD